MATTCPSIIFLINLLITVSSSIDHEGFVIESEIEGKWGYFSRLVIKKWMWVFIPGDTFDMKCIGCLDEFLIFDHIVFV